MNTALLLMAQYGGKAIPIDDVCRDYGVDISKRQVVRLISEGLEAFAAEDRDVLRAGLATAPWITVEYVGAPRPPGWLHHPDRRLPLHRVPHREIEVTGNEAIPMRER
jgi:hypothetical protein